MIKNNIDLDKELSELEKNSDKSIRYINKGVYFLTGVMVGLFPFALLTIFLTFHYSNNYILEFFALTFYVLYIITFYLLFNKSVIIDNFLRRKWVAKYLYRPHERSIK